MTDDRPLRRQYARIERERRFLLKQLPADVNPADFVRLRDCYVHGARLRVRRVEAPDGELLLVKLGRKEADPEAPDDPTRQVMTTLYLGPDEYAAIELLDGARSVKRRYKLAEQGGTFAIDVYEEPKAAAGTIIAEVECDTDEELAAVPMPNWAEREVTAASVWSGPALAGMRFG